MLPNPSKPAIPKCIKWNASDITGNKVYNDIDSSNQNLRSNKDDD